MKIRFQWRRAFTLVELLVVIAIIGLLAALLLPVLSRARMKAYQVRCLGNVKQLSLAGLTYCNESGKPVFYDSSSYPGGAWMGALSDYIKNRDLFVCPVAPLHNPPPESGNTEGTADRAWVRWTADGKTMFVGGYAYNAWLFSDAYNYFSDSMPEKWVFTRESSIESPALTPIFVDANWVDLSPEETDSPWPDLYSGQPLGEGRHGGIGRCTIARHGGTSPASAPRTMAPGQKLPGAVLMGLADGHSQAVKLEELWNYRWHRDWQTPAQRPP